MTEPQTETRKADILRKVRGLLDTAASFQQTGNYEAAESYQAKADEMMMRYAIAEAELAFARPANEREKPVFRDYDYEAQGFGDVSQQLASTFSELCRTVGIMRVDWSWKTAKLIGYAADLDYLDLLWTSLKLQMVSELAPSPLPSKTLEENLIMLKETGLTWEEIFRRLRAAGFYPAEQVWERRIGVKYTGIYTRYCQATGRKRQYANPSVYRRSFLDGYIRRLGGRLREMRDVRDRGAVGHELVLAGREDAIKELYYELHPEARPHPADCRCDQCHFMKCKDETCTRPRCVEYRRNKNKPVRMSSFREPVMDADAHNMGRAAADRADLSRGRGHVTGNSGTLKP